MTVDAARLSVQARNAHILDGVDPDAHVVRQTRRHTLTVHDLIETYAEQHLPQVSTKHATEFYRVVAPWLAPPRSTTTRRGLNLRRSIDAFGVKFGKIPAEKIAPLDVADYLKQFTSPSTFNVALGYVKALYNWGIRMQIIDTRNPCSPIDRQKIIKQRRDYTPEDVAAVAAWIFNPPIEVIQPQAVITGAEKRNAALVRGTVAVQNAQMRELCAFLGILMLTMARPMELRHARFEHFDLERLIWRKHDTKGIKLSRATYEYSHRSVPIHPKVAELVVQQRERWPESDLVFPSHTDITKPRDNFTTILKRFKQLPDVPPAFQMYDIKRMAISLMIAGQGIRREDLSHYVDHKGDLATTMIYDLGFVDPMRPVTTRLGELLGV